MHNDVSTAKMILCNFVSLCLQKCSVDITSYYKTPVFCIMVIITTVVICFPRTC